MLTIMLPQLQYAQIMLTKIYNSSAVKELSIFLWYRQYFSHWYIDALENRGGVSDF